MKSHGTTKSLLNRVNKTEKTKSSFNTVKSIGKENTLLPYREKKIDKTTSSSKALKSVDRSKSISNNIKKFRKTKFNAVKSIGRARSSSDVISDAILSRGRFHNITEQNDATNVYPLQIYNKKYIN